jgi:hypothetical protein
MRRAVPIAAFLLAGIGSDRAPARAHNGPPYPIVTNRVTGPYSVSIWTDPDTTDDDRAAGQFWVILETAARGGSIAADTRATVAIRPLDRAGATLSGRAEPVDGAVERQFVALRMDHEGRFAVEVSVEGPLGRGTVESAVEATYDSRPPPFTLAVYLLPFVAVGALWVRVLLRRRRAPVADRGASRSGSRSVRR